MGYEYKRLEFKDSRHGKRELAKTLNVLGNDGWRVVDTDSRQGKFGIAKTVGLGVLFLPLALKGRKKGKISVTLERD